MTELRIWNRKIVPPGSEMTPAELAELVAFGEGRLMLCCELKNAESNFLPIILAANKNLA